MTVSEGLPAPIASVLCDHLRKEAEKLIGEPSLCQLLIAAGDWLDSAQTTTSDQKDHLEKVEVDGRGPSPDSQPTVCRFFKQGKCRFGDQCRSLHPGVKRKTVQPEPAAAKPETKAKTAVVDDADEDEKKSPMRIITDVIHRIQWDDDLDQAKFVLGYLDRFTGEVERPFSAFCWEDLASVDSTRVLAVPKHRFQFVKYDGEIVWDKRVQLDNFFGSRGDGTTIADVVARHKKSETAAAASVADINDDFDLHDDSAGGRGKHENLDRPNYFVCIRMSNPSIRQRARQVQDALVSRDGRLADGLLPVSALHITACVLQVKNDSQLETAKRVMCDAQRHMVALFSGAEPLTVHGVADFRGRVIYGALETTPEMQRLHRLLVRRFNDAGIATPGNYEPFTAHMTIMKMTRPMCREMATSHVDSAAYRDFVDAEFGTQVVDNVHLCPMARKFEEDGFYHREETIDISLVSLSQLMPALLAERADKLHEDGMIGANEAAVICAGLVSDNGVERQRAVQAMTLSVDQSSSWMEDEEEKDLDSGRTAGTVYILRGLPGSGKSFLTQRLKQQVSGRPFKVCSADDYFETKGTAAEYDFHAEKLDAAHQHCLDTFLEAIRSGASTVVVDNTHVQRWEYSVYVRLAQLFGYGLRILEIPCPDVAMAKVFAARCQHKVLTPTVLRMHERWEKDQRATTVPAWLPGDEEAAPLETLVADRKPAVVLFAAVFVTQKSRRRLLEVYPATHPTINADHVTLCFAPSDDYTEKLQLGQTVQLAVLGMGDDGHVQAVAVELQDGVKSENHIAHITISLGPGAHAKDSNTMLQAMRDSGKSLVKNGDLLLSGTTGCVVTMPDGDKHLVVDNDRLKQLLNQGAPRHEAAVLTGAATKQVNKLLIFDFDGTLVDSVGPAEGPGVYHQLTNDAWPHSGWLSCPQSLQSPLPVLPGPAMTAFRRLYDSPNSACIVLTGRKVVVKDAVQGVLRDFNCVPERCVLRPATEGSTQLYKFNAIAELVKEYNATSVHLWEDLAENLAVMHELAKKHPKVEWNIEDVGPISNSRSVDPVLEYVSEYGSLTSTTDRAHTQVAVQFVAEAWASLVTAAVPDAASIPLRRLAKPFGSYLLGRRSDVDLCLLAPSCPALNTPMRCMETLAEELERRGTAYVHRAYSSRCPCLRVKLLLTNTAPVELDLLFAVIPLSTFNVLREHDQASPKLMTSVPKSDVTSRTALGGPVFSENVLDAVKGHCTRQVFAAVVETIVVLLRGANLKGNACHLPRTFHMVKLLAQFVAQLDAQSNNITATCLFKDFITHVTARTSEQWAELFKEFCPTGVHLPGRQPLC